MIKKIILITVTVIAFIFNSFSLSAQCKVKPIVKAGMARLDPYEYDSYVVKEIVYGEKPKKETVNFEVFSNEEYKLIFCQTVLPQEVGVTIYGKVKGKKEILYFDESGKKAGQDFNFGPSRSGTYYVEYEIPAATAPNQKGCIVVVIGIRE